MGRSPRSFVVADQRAWLVSVTLILLSVGGLARAQTMQCEIPNPNGPAWPMIVQLGAGSLSIAFPSGVWEHPVIRREGSYVVVLARAQGAVDRLYAFDFERKQAAEAGVNVPVPFGDDPGQVHAFSNLDACR